MQKLNQYLWRIINRLLVPQRAAVKMDPPRGYTARKLALPGNWFILTKVKPKELL